MRDKPRDPFRDRRVYKSRPAGVGASMRATSPSRASISSPPITKSRILVARLRKRARSLAPDGLPGSPIASRMSARSSGPWRLSSRRRVPAFCGVLAEQLQHQVDARAPARHVVLQVGVELVVLAIQFGGKTDHNRALFERREREPPREFGQCEPHALGEARRHARPHPCLQGAEPRAGFDARRARARRPRRHLGRAASRPPRARRTGSARRGPSAARGASAPCAGPAARRASAARRRDARGCFGMARPPASSSDLE